MEEDWLDTLISGPTSGSGKLVGIAPESIPPDERYDVVGLLGRGATGCVVEVVDKHLKRTLAMKILTKPTGSMPMRFIAEAQATAQLQHPNIISVHDLGSLPDGRWFFTMPKVVGRTMRDMIADVHAVSRQEWSTTPTGWSLRRLVEALRSVGAAVAYAHDKGVTHRDLKPTNVMIGRFGEVLVLDWGIARIGEVPPEALFESPVSTVRTENAGFTTRGGVVAGTPGFMAPEQANGDLLSIGPRTDVWGLGGLLYAILANRPPYVGDRLTRQVLAGPPEPPRGPGPPPPQGLIEVVVRALSPDPDHRHSSALAFANALTLWLDAT